MADAPLYTPPPNTMVLISEEAQPSYTTLYRGNVSNTQNDVDALEVAMPMWLAQCLLLNQIPASAPLPKLSFVLMPWNKDPEVDPLPELLNTFVFFCLTWLTSDKLFSPSGPNQSLPQVGTFVFGRSSRT